MNCCRLLGSFSVKPKEIHFQNAETLQWDKRHLGFVRVWNWCYLNKGKIVWSSSSKWIYIFIQMLRKYKTHNTLLVWTLNIGHAVHCFQGLLLLRKDNVGLIWHLGLSLRVHHCCFMNSPTHPFPRQKKRSFLRKLVKLISGSNLENGRAICSGLRDQCF